MSTPARKRLMRDFKRLQQDPPAGISGAPEENNIMLWNAVIFGWVYNNMSNQYRFVLSKLRILIQVLVSCLIWNAALMILHGTEVSNPATEAFYWEGKCWMVYSGLLLYYLHLLMIIERFENSSWTLYHILEIVKTKSVVLVT